MTTAREDKENAGQGRERGDSTPPSPRRRRPLSGRSRTVGSLLLLVLLVAGGGWLFLRSGDDSEPRIGEPELADTSAARASARDSVLDLPDLDASDELVRRLIAGLSSHPRLAEWVATDELIRRFVRTVASVAAGTSPRSELGFMAPEGEFRVRRPDTTVFVAPASYRRYDPVAATFVSVDTRGSARLYRRLRPLFQEAYRDLGFQESSFETAMARAVENLLAVPVPEGPVELVPNGADAWEFRDPALEELSPAQKHLLRMGPHNVRRIQTKLRELSAELDLPVLTTAGG